MQTPLHACHLELGARMVDFAGWELPLWYKSGQSAEHHATRTACGLFDICHMGEFRIQGEGTEAFFCKVLSNKISGMEIGQAKYSFLLNPSGGVIDDCLLYRFDDQEWMLVVNAANRDEDFQWLKQHAPDSVTIQDISDETVKIDLQGPKAPQLLAQLVPDGTLNHFRFFHFIKDVKIGDIPVLVSRTGYTGEIGFEIYTSIDHGVDLWNIFLEKGKEFELLPCGLGARDTLRVEAGLPLHGHELSPDIPAVGHPWMFAVNFDHEFIGKQALLQKMDAPDSFVFPIRIEGRRKAMPEWQVIKNNQIIGTVVTGVTSPTLENQPVGFIRIDQSLEAGEIVLCKDSNRGTEVTAIISEIPFVPLTSRKKMSLFLT